MNKVNVGMNIKLARESAGVSQSELAYKIGESRQTIYKYENGIVTNIPLQKIEAIARVLGVDPQIITGWDERYENKIVTAEGEYGSLTEEERSVLTKYNLLTDVNRIRIVERMDMLLEEQEKLFRKNA